jgi:RNA polymerase sigma-70 factor, ECF subfamily
MATIERYCEGGAAPAAVDEAVSRARAGDRAAFDRLYEWNVGRVYGLCLRMAGEAEAERLVQDVFVQAWRGLATFRGQSAFSTWLHRLAINVVLQWRRQEGRRMGRFELVADPATTPRAPVAAPDDVARRMDLERAIASLPVGARTVLVLHDIEGYTHEEIADLCGLAVGTTKAQLHRARRLLRERLDP